MTKINKVAEILSEPQFVIVCPQQYPLNPWVSPKINANVACGFI